MIGVDTRGSREQLMLACASMYYMQDMKMEAIAARLHVSRSSVSRLLRDARASGLVEISIRPPLEAQSAVGQRLSELFGPVVHVVPVLSAATGAERLDQVARTAARLLGNWFDSGMTLGVAWGTTVAAVTKHLAGKPTRASSVVQLNGSANTRTHGVEFAGDMLARISRVFDAQPHLFPVPAFFDFASTREAMWRERSVARILQLQRNADIALFGVGALTGPIPSRVYAGGYLEPADVRQLSREGVVGDVCTVFLRADGTYRDLELNQRATGPTPIELQSIPRRVCAVAGDHKAIPLLAALRAGAITDLVIDDLTAQAVFDSLSPAERAGRRAQR